MKVCPEAVCPSGTTLHTGAPSGCIFGASPEARAWNMVVIASDWTPSQGAAVGTATGGRPASGGGADTVGCGGGSAPASGGSSANSDSLLPPPQPSAAAARAKSTAEPNDLPVTVICGLLAHALPHAAAPRSDSCARGRSYTRRRPGATSEAPSPGRASAGAPAAAAPLARRSRRSAGPAHELAQDAH